jgi:hypothetical protein
MVMTMSEAPWLPQGFGIELGLYACQANIVLERDGWECGRQITTFYVAAFSEQEARAKARSIYPQPGSVVDGKNVIDGGALTVEKVLT